jgi:hypothetical protein
MLLGQEDAPKVSRSVHDARLEEVWKWRVLVSRGEVEEATSAHNWWRENKDSC